MDSKCVAFNSSQMKAEKVEVPQLEMGESKNDQIKKGDSPTMIKKLTLTCNVADSSNTLEIDPSHSKKIEEQCTREDDMNHIGFAEVQKGNSGNVGGDSSQAPTEDLDAEEENCEMDVVVTPSAVLESLPDIPDDDFLSPEWKMYIQCLTSSVKSISNLLVEEYSSHQKNTMEITELKSEIEKLKKELNVSRQWQNTMYTNMQNTMMHYQQYYQQLSYMYMGYGNYQQLVPGSDAHGLPNGFAPDSANVTGNKVSKSASGTVTESKAVAYGDSVISKKLAERRRYKCKNNDDEANSTEVVSNISNETWKEYKTEEQKTVNDVTIAEVHPAVNENIASKDRPDGGMECSNDSKLDENVLSASDKSIEETLREAAESVVSKTGFTYDETSGLYYDWNLKMYYDPSTQLYFDHENGIYYYYDTEKGSYIFHSQVDVSPEENGIVKSNVDSSLSDGEIVSDDSDSECVDPCVRVIAVKSDSLSLGSLFIITCKGGTIGRDPTCLITIPEERVSRTHSYILYDDEDKMFYIQDNKTQNGTFLNEERIADPKTSSEPVEITHRDLIKIGDTELSFHIHIGRETCLQCEPGSIQANIIQQERINEIFTKEDRDAERKRQAKFIRKKYGINPGYIPKGLINSIPDRASMRRKEFGVDAYKSTELPVMQASVVKEIPSDNKGHKMLAKMGWKSGEGLGKSGGGIVNPITVHKLGKGRGLGGGVKASLDHVGESRKQSNWEKARERYNKCE